MLRYGRFCRLLAGLSFVVSLVAVTAAQSDSGLVAAYISAGQRHTVGTRPDGTVIAWGDNNYNQLGVPDNQVKRLLVPGSVPGMPPAIQTAAGDGFSLALAADGTVWGCGSNTYGEVGRSDPRPKPGVSQIPRLTGIARISARSTHAIALKNDGTVWTWGSNYNGEMGNGTLSIFNSEPQMVPNLAGVREIVAADYHNLALKGDGTVWAWGKNGGRLGINSVSASQTRPEQVPGISQVVGISAGSAFNVAVTSGTLVFTWGLGEFGSLGLGKSVSFASRPTKVPGLAGIVEVQAGSYHCLARTYFSTLYSWGDNEKGQLGIGSLEPDVSSPTPVNSLSNVMGMSGGQADSFAVLSNGSVWAWGRNENGELGDDTKIERRSPVQVQIGN